LQRGDKRISRIRWRQQMQRAISVVRGQGAHREFFGNLEGIHAEAAPNKEAAPLGGSLFEIHGRVVTPAL
jgi:hypothetical protein